MSKEASLSSMKMDTAQRRSGVGADGPALWIALAAGLLLMLLAAASRTGGQALLLNAVFVQEVESFNCVV